MPSGARVVTRPFLLLTGTTLAAFLAIGMLLPVLPLFAKAELGLGSTGVGLVVAAASPTALVFQPLAGRLGDRRGRRPLIVAGSLVMAVTIAGYALVESTVPLVALRLASGTGEALVFVGTATVVNDLAPEGRRGEAVSLYSLAVWGGLALGPLAGEAALGDGHYAAVWLLAAACAGSSALVGLLLPETRPSAAPGAPAGRLVHPAAFLPGLVLVAAAIGFAGFNAFVALYARELGLDGAGSVFATFAGVVFALRIVGRRVPDRFGAKPTARLALLLVAGGFAVMAAWRDPVGLFAGTILFGCGQAFAFPALMTLAVSAAPPAERSAVVGTFSASFDAGFAVGAVTLGAVASAGGYPAVFAVAAAVALASLAVLRQAAEWPPVPAPAASGAPP